MSKIVLGQNYENAKEGVSKPYWQKGDAIVGNIKVPSVKTKAKKNTDDLICCHCIKFLTLHL